MAHRHGYCTLIGVDVGITLDHSDRCTGARLVLPWGAGIPYPAVEAEELVIGVDLALAAVAQAARQATASIEVPADAFASGAYRGRVTRVHAERALTQAYRRAQQMEPA